MIQNFADWFVYTFLEFVPETRVGEAVNFFVYDTIKILFLLYAISLVMGVVNAYFPVERVRVFLTTKKLFGLQYLFASLFGAITPFCSCSSIPLFIGFVKGGIPLGVTLSYLITSPLVNEVAVALFIGVFGIKVTMLYVASGVILGMLGGIILERFHLEHLLSPWVKNYLMASNEKEGTVEWHRQTLKFKERLPFIARDAWEIVRGVVLYVILGIAVGAAVHGYVPEGFFEKYLQSDQWWGVFVAVFCGVPMYANAAGIVPVIQVFVAKGIPLGTALAFMMATVGLSLPEAILLKKVMTWKLIGIFFGVVFLLILLSGYLFNTIV